MKFTVHVYIHQAFVESPQRPWLGATDTPSAEQTSREADPWEGSGQRDTRERGEASRASDSPSTQEPGGGALSTSSDAWKEATGVVPACAEPGRTLGTVSCWECVVCPPERKCGPMTGREPVCARRVISPILLMLCHEQEQALPAISECCPLMQISPSAPSPALCGSVGTPPPQASPRSAASAL